MLEVEDEQSASRLETRLEIAALEDRLQIRPQPQLFGAAGVLIQIPDASAFGGGTSNGPVDQATRAPADTAPARTNGGTADR